MMTAAIEAALPLMKERLEATIVPMQRTLESLQAEFVALRAEEKLIQSSSGSGPGLHQDPKGSEISALGALSGVA